MKHPQKRYSSEAAIIARIDSEKERAADNNRLASEKEEASKLAYKNEDIRAGDRLKEEAVKHRQKARRIEESRLPKLRDALAEFRTMPMEAVLGNDLAAPCEI